MVLALVWLGMSCGLLPTRPACEHPRVSLRQGMLLWLCSVAHGQTATFRYLASSGWSLELVINSFIIASVSLSSLVDNGLGRKA